MVEEFNGAIYLTIYLALLVCGGFYGYQCLFTTRKFLDKYGFHHSAGFFARFAGVLITAQTLVGIYLLVSGVGGSWAYFVYGFLGTGMMTFAGYHTIKLSPEFSDIEGLKYTAEGYAVPAGLCIGWAVLIYGLSDKIYA